jgi:ring-1,2-phenylacetyl-CoA epoxidase subunit PaaD
MVSAVASRSAYDVAAETPDPELPFVTIADLGILRDVTVTGDGVLVTITPTYSGCPAMREIADDVANRLRRAGHGHVRVRFTLAPAWTSDWITPDGRRKLAAAGIAPPSPARRTGGPVPVTLGRRADPPCPHCGSGNTEQTAAFSATACKSLHRCRTCHEPFEAVKPL